MKLLKNVRNKVSYIVKMKSQKGIGGFLRNIGHIKAEHRVKKMWHIIKMVAYLLYKVWQHNISAPVGHKRVAQNKSRLF